MTNNHVLGSVIAAQDAVAVFDFDHLDAKTTKMKLDPRTFFLTRCVAIPTYSFFRFHRILSRSRELDCSVVAIHPQDLPIDVKRQAIELPEKGPSMKVGDLVHIYQHPHGQPKCSATQTIAKVKGNHLMYLADTDPGSSGSPVLNSQYIVVGLHRAGDDEANQGVMIGAIVSWLQTQRVRG